MIRRLPLLPTIVVVAAAAIMVALGFWQLGKVEAKAALIASYEEAGGEAAPVPFPQDGEGEAVWFRRSTLDCTDPGAAEPVAGTAANGAKGWTVRVECSSGSRPDALVDLGFSQDLDLPVWEGGRVEGIVAPGPRLVADPPVAGLQPLAKPDPRELPNNHLSYAIQWFGFALTALVIFFLAVRARIGRR
ncbi:SURF1 family cytochrome oxidase biogenesis protein [Erythrobacter sp.]|jgi:surfeit locus 1 family protein|uniref:SURF1 family cytochrome oxidase biogenesis protein n=1 Tax=Erythrobacter sp. TaxID=1042 RepID=UPI002EAF0370|nr:SURF1 family cytochrome oxidase biogenesis protein [Erythrobacter sp.]